ncbi:MAG: hypothetical protein OXC48_06765 [Endozoicomonadaceae bacterium]|nr:hypothetical protein [Endozoicomonadaceae bacterium]
MLSKLFKNTNFFAYLSIILCGLCLSFSTQSIGALKNNTTEVQQKNQNNPLPDLQENSREFISVYSDDVTPEDIDDFYSTQLEYWELISQSPFKNKACKILTQLQEAENLYEANEEDARSIKILSDLYKSIIIMIARGKPIALMVSKLGRLLNPDADTSPLPANILLMLATYTMQSEQNTLPQNTDLKKLLIELYLVEYQTKNAAIQQENIAFLDESELLPHVYLPENSSVNSEKDNSNLQDNMQKTSKWWRPSKSKLLKGAEIVSIITGGYFIWKLLSRITITINL